MKFLRVAIVGSGKIADGHVEEVNKQQEAKVVAVCDAEPLMAEQLAMRFAVPRHYGNFLEMLQQEKLDVIHITTPPQSHLALASQAMEHGCHAYVEKPLAMDATEARQLVALAERTGRKLTIGYWYNFEPQMEEVLQMWREGVLGDVTHVESFYGYSLAGAYGSAFLNDPNHWLHRLRGKLFHNILDHILNKITLFLDDESPQIRALGYKRRPELRGGIGDAVLDELRVIVMGHQVTGYATLSSHVRAGHFLRVYGTKNTVSADFNTRSVVLEKQPTLPSAIGRVLPPFSQAREHWRRGWRNVRMFSRSEYHFFAGMNRLIGLFYDCIRNDGPPPVPYQDMLRISTMMDEIFRQVPQDLLPQEPPK